MKETIKHLDFIISRTNEIIHHYVKQDVLTIQYFYLGMCERLNAGSKSLKLLAIAIEQDQEHEFSAGLVVRTLLLDFLIGLRGYDIFTQGEVNKKLQKEIHEEVTEYCNIVLGDGVVYTLKHFKAFQSSGAITEAELHIVYENMSKTYSRFLQPFLNDGNMPVSKFPRAPQVRELFTILSGGTPELKELAKNYDTYSFYSKYEHFNILSYDLMRRLSDYQVRTLSKSIELLVLHLFISIKMMENNAPDDFLKENIQLVGGYIKHEVLKAK